MPTPGAIDTGLDKAQANTGGWADFRVEAANNKPVRLDLDLGASLSPNWAAYGKLWSQPTLGTFGGLGGVRMMNTVDLFVSGQGNTKGEYSVMGGIQIRF